MLIFVNDFCKHLFRRITSPFTLYWTLNLILETFSSKNPPENEVDAKSGDPILRKYQQNFFEPVPEENKCQDIGVPEEFCPCYIPEYSPIDDPIVLKAALSAVAKINKDLTPKCSPLRVNKVTAATVFNMPARRNDPIVNRYVVAFTTTPGDFLIEAGGQYFVQNGTFSHMVDVHRENSINKKHVQCIKDSKLELFCFCI